MGSTSYLAKPKSAGYRIKSGSSNAGSDKEMNGKLKRNKIRRPTKMTDYGLKRVPDYTEMAYKEAVSKLRYFLSGNYAPSVRSYGSPSIRNLDESDGDAKYSHSPVFADLKARPRLTTKYTTLYADSLNNYAPTTHIPTAVPPPTTSVGAGDSTNPDVVNFIQKQEEYIEQLERESQYCRDELNNLLGKVKEVISENEHLHEAQKNKLISRMFHSYNGGSETDDLDDIGDSTGLDSDNKISPSKSRRTSSAKYRGSSKLEGPNIVFESRIAELEAQLTQAKIDLKKIQEENNENKRKLASGLVDSTCLDGFKRQIDNLQRDKSALESQISKLKLSLDYKDDDDRYKRNDSVELQLRDERNNLEVELRRLKDDLAKERGKVRELAGEGTRRAIQERSAAEQRYNAHFDELQHDLAAQYDNVAKLQLELERQRRDENDLKRELSMKNSAIEELKMELKNKSSTLQADLSQANAEKASLEEELASARLAIERHQRQAKHEANRLNSEIQSLRQRLDRADADLVHSRRENLRLSEQISTLEKEINMKSLTPMTPEKNKKEKELSSMLESMDNKHANTVAELETMIHSQNSLMEKLTGECRSLTDKLDDANRRHKEELATLQRQVDGLGKSLQSTPRLPPTSYQAPPTHQTATYRDIPAAAPARRNDPRTESTGDTGHHPVSPVRVQRNDSQASLVKQASRTSLYSQPDRNAKTEHIDDAYTDNDVPYTDTAPVSANVTNNTPYTKDTINSQNVNVPSMDNVEETKIEDSAEEPTQEYEKQNYDGSYEQPYEQTQPAEYEQTQPVEYEQTHPAEYEQTQSAEYEQPVYTEGQYDNYEQYTDPNAQYTDPNAQYTDPNAQYTDPNAQYEGYVDPNYQEQDYDNTQYTQEYQETPYTEVPTSESKDEVPSQS